MTDYFTSDWHLGHGNIIKYCSRPFKNTDEMDSVILNNVNEVVLPDDRLFNVGDVGFKGAMFHEIRPRINCKNIFVVPGNHDREHTLRKYFTVLPQEYMYETDGYRLVLSHYADRVWAHSHHGAGHLYGHSHGKLPSLPGVMAFDVGVDAWNFKPLSLGQVKAEMKRLVALADETKCPMCGSHKTVVGDHHGAK